MPNKRGRRGRRSRNPGTCSIVQNLTSSPWRHIRFSLEVDSKVGAWGRLTNSSIAKALHTHLGFAPSSSQYLEIRYERVSVRRMSPGTALSMRLYRIESSFTQDSKVAVMSEVESYASSSIHYAQCSLFWDAVSQKTPLTVDEVQPVMALYSHLGTDVVCVVMMSLWYRHASTPFENEPTGRIQLDYENVALEQATAQTELQKFQQDGIVGRDWFSVSQSQVPRL